MFGKKNNTLKLESFDETALVQFSQLVEITKKTTVTVPPNYRAIAFIDGKPLFRIEACEKKQFVKADKKEYLGQNLKIAYIASHSFAQSPWGFGNIQVNNSALKEAYRVGVNGKFSVDVTDYTKLISAFPTKDVITADDVREKCISSIKTVGTPIVADYFSKTETSVFEMSSLTSDFRTKFSEALMEEKIFSDLGIKISLLTVDGFYANEDDLKIIRERINK